MAKRSPILGFNHNFRHRGLVFHVQTEDSGVNNPHIFTHLFNGGVILSSRKLTYDEGAAEEVVKALMQAQHKAMLKDLKSGTFDQKITDYFGSDPNLDGGNTIPEPAEPTEPSAGHPAIEETATLAEPAAPLDLEAPNTTQKTPALQIPIGVEDGEPISEEVEVLQLDDIEVVDEDSSNTDAESEYKSRTASVDEEIEVITAAIDVMEDEALAANAPPSTQPLEPLDLIESTDSLDEAAPAAPPVAVPAEADQTVRTRRDGRRNPFDSLELDFGGDPKDTIRRPAPVKPVAETPSGAVLIHASAPESAPKPPGAVPANVGQYARHSTGKMRRIVPTDLVPPDTGQAPVVPAPPQVAEHAPVGKGTKHRPRTQTLPMQSDPQSVKRAVVPRPSVIVGAPPQVIGQPAAPTRAPSQSDTQATATPAASTPRRAREQAGGSLFGKDLISEKSLDEVILAYLSEDGGDDGGGE